jgi:hypothetical protein
MKVKLFNKSSDWIDEVISLDGKDLLKIEETARNFYSPHTHSGIIGYLYLCWVNGYGGCLRPDMIWTTILNELAITKLSSVFNMSEAKKEITTIQSLSLKANDHQAIDINDLTSKCKKTIMSRDIFDVISNTSFSVDVPLANYLTKMIFVYSSPKVKNKQNPEKYSINNCQGHIKKFEIQGTYDDWRKLYKAVDKLSLLGQSNNGKSKTEWGGFENFSGHNSNSIIEYTKKCKDTIQMIITNRTNANFQKDVFNCDDSHNVKGWITNFYIKSPLKINDYNSHIKHVPYKSINFMGQEDYYCQIGGLCHSVLNKNAMLLPQYGILQFKILDPNVYKQFREIDMNFIEEFSQTIDNQYTNFKFNQMNPIIQHNPINNFLQKDPYMPQNSYLQQSQYPQDQLLQQQPSYIPQSILFSLDRTHVTKPVGGEYINVFENDKSIPRTGGSLP